MAEATERIPQHRHCYVCGKAFVGEGRYCGDSCKENKTVELKKMKRKYYLIFGVAVAMMIFAIAYPFLHL